MKANNRISLIMHFTCKDSDMIKSIQTIEKISMFSN